MKHDAAYYEGKALEALQVDPMQSYAAHGIATAQVYATLAQAAALKQFHVPRDPRSIRTRTNWSARADH